MIYIIVLIFLLIGVFVFEDGHDTKMRKRWYKLEWLILVLLAGLRYKVGGDTLGYHETYSNYTSFFNMKFTDLFSSDGNILWMLLSYLCKTICSDFVLFQIVHAVIFNTAIFYFFKKQTRRIFLAVLLYFIFYYFIYNMEILRASLAVSVFLFSYKYFENKQWNKYLMCSLLALGFHSEAIFIFLFPIVHMLAKLHINLRSLGLLIVVTLVVFTINLIPYIQSVLSFSSSMSESLDYYGGRSDQGAGITFMGYTKIIILSSLWLLNLIVFRKDKVNLLRGWSFLLFFFYWQSFNYSNIFYRAMDFSNPILILSICSILEYCKGRLHLVTRGLLCSITIVMLIELITLYASGKIIIYYPYSSVFNPVDYPEREYLWNLDWQ